MEHFGLGVSDRLKSDLRSYEYRVICDRCAEKLWNYELKEEWDGFRVCEECWETRNILDFYTTPNDTHQLPWVRADQDSSSQAFQQQRNILRGSQELGNAGFWTPNNTVVPITNYHAPDETTTACKVNELATNSVHTIFPTSLDVGSGLVAAFSVFAKAAERNWIQLVASNKDGTVFTANFDILNGKIGSNSGFASPLNIQITPFPEGWYRCEIRNANGVGASAPQNNIRLLPIDTLTTTYQGVVGSGVYLWGAQLEAVVVPRFASTYQNIPASTGFVVPAATSSTWSPIFSAGAISTTGNVDITGQFIQSGSTVSFQIELAPNKTTNSIVFMNGGTVTLPFTAAAAGTWRMMNQFKLVTGTINPADTVITFSAVTNASPTIDSIIISGKYGV